MEIYEILDGRLYQSGAPQEAAEWTSIHAHAIDVVVHLFKVLVHRHMGKSRSGLVNALVAMKILGISGREAVEFVRQRRPGALGNAVFARYLESRPSTAPAAPAL